MLEKLKELSINLWSPVGDIFAAIAGASNTWFPIVAYIVLSILGLIVLRKFLDMTVSGVSSLSLSTIWFFVKKILFYGIIISVGLSVVVTLYFYLDSMYHDYSKEVEKKEDRRQSVDYLLR